MIKNSVVAGSAAAASVAGIPIIGPALAIPTGLATQASVASTFLPQLAALAAGGITTGPTAALIGEAGPEAVIPLGSGKAKKAFEQAGIGNTGTDIKELQVNVSFPGVREASQGQMRRASQSLGAMTIKQIENARRLEGRRGTRTI